MNQVDQSGWLEVGLGVFALSMLLGGMLFLLGRSQEDQNDHNLKSKGSTAAGAVPAERHQNIKTVAAR
jgi:hypothetical protein